VSASSSPAIRFCSSGDGTRLWIGRRLPALFGAAGLREIELRLFPMQSTRFDEWSRRLGIVAAAERVGGAAAAAWLDDLRARDRAGRFFAANTFFMASATR
jgi:hypothetical protein